MSAYYNEFDPYAAQWLRNLIAAGHIAPGDVDERSIEDVRPDDLKGYTQVHMFAGVGVWSLALRRAGWEDNRPVWTGSCPCQPFSAAGKGGGVNDERHLWPAWFQLIAQREPSVVFGEQVASKDGLGWLDLVQTDLEGTGYANAAVDLCSAGVGAPHIRQRLWFVAERMDNPNSPGLEGYARDGSNARRKTADRSTPETGVSGRMVDTEVTVGRGSNRQEVNRGRITETGRPDVRDTAGPTNGIWADVDWLLCRDDKFRPVEPGTFPLANGVAPRLVFSCASCETQVISNDELCYVQKINGGNERREPAEILFSILHGGSVRSGSTEGWPEAGAVPNKENGTVQPVPLEKEPTAAPQRRQHEEQRIAELGSSLQQMPPGTPQDYPRSNVRGLLERIFSAQEKKQNLFCPVCEGVGPHKCEKEMVSRVGLLRAYGNAINVEAAKTFIEAYLDVSN